jgi:hypothetical protein
MALLLALAGAGVAPPLCVDPHTGAANASCFGFDPADSTPYLQAALSSGATQIYIDGARHWVTSPLFVPENCSNLHVVLRAGTQLLAKRDEYHRGSDTLLSFGTFESDLAGKRMENVSLTCEPGSLIAMRRVDYDNQTAGLNYSHNEHRHAVQFHSATNAAVSGCRIEDTGGDGIYLRSARNVTIRHTTIRRAYRNGITITSGDGVVLEDVQVFDTNGTAPRSGIDIEPNTNKSSLANITLRRVLVDGAGGCGIEIKHAFAMAASPIPIGILVDSCVVRNIARAGIHHAAPSWGKGRDPYPQHVRVQYIVRGILGR